MYVREDQRGNEYLFSDDRHDLADFSDFGDATAHSEDFRTVSTFALDREDGVAFGRGGSSNPDKAEAYFYLDAQNGSASSFTDGRYRLVVLNAANKVVAVLDRGTLAEVANGDPSTDSRGDWGKPLPYRTIANGKGEVLGGSGHKIGLQIELYTDGDTETFSTANSEMIAEGYRGSLQN
jgi:hypothetical protein